MKVEVKKIIAIKNCSKCDYMDPLVSPRLEV